jgi:hypothetical protein
MRGPVLFLVGILLGGVAGAAAIGALRAPPATTERPDAGAFLAARANGTSPSGAVRSVQAEGGLSQGLGVCVDACVDVLGSTQVALKLAPRPRGGDYNLTVQWNATSSTTQRLNAELRECPSEGCSGSDGRLYRAGGPSPLRLRGSFPTVPAGDALFLVVSAQETNRPLRQAADQPFVVRGFFSS